MQKEIILNIEDEFKSYLEDTIDKITVITAYVTSYGFDFIESYLSDDVKDRTIIFRGRLDDFIKKNNNYSSSDFDFDRAVNNGWSIYINFDLHAKMYVFDKKYIISGSSNLTKGGLELNKERNTLGKFTKEDEKYIDNLLDSSSKVNKNDLKKIKEILVSLEKPEENSIANLKREWDKVFVSPDLKEKIPIKNLDLLRREKLFLENRIKTLKQRFKSDCMTFMNRIKSEKDISNIPKEYIIDLNSSEVNYNDCNFKVKKYLLNYYKLYNNFFIEKHDYSKYSLKNNLNSASDEQKERMLKKIIKALKELYKQKIKVNLDFNEIYCYGSKGEAKLKFIDYSKVDIKERDLERIYRKNLKELFDDNNIIDAFELGGRECE